MDLGFRVAERNCRMDKLKDHKLQKKRYKTVCSVQEAFVSDKLAFVTVAGWERLKIKSKIQKVQTVKPKQRMPSYMRVGNSSIIGLKGC